MNNREALTEQQVRDLQQLISLPDDIRARAVAFAAGMLAAKSLAGIDKEKTKSESA